MAQDEEKVLVGGDVVAGTDNQVALGVVYAIRSVSSAKYLDGRNKDDSNPLLTGRNPKGDKYLHWMIVKTNNNNYAIRSISSEKYLNGRYKQHRFARITNGDPNNAKHLQWTFKIGNDNTIAIYSISSEKYLDGRKEFQTHPLTTIGDPKKNPFLQWTFIPQNVHLKVEISNFDFGKEDDILALLNKNKTIAFNDTREINAEEKGYEASGSYGETIEESFEYGFDQTVGIGVETEIACNVPLLAEGKVKISGSFKFTATKQMSKSSSRSYETAYAFKPAEIGRYSIGLIVYEAKNQKLPFTANVLAIATDSNGDKCSGDAVTTILKYKGSNVNITKINDNSVEATIKGSMIATWGVSSKEYVERIEEEDDDDDDDGDE